MIKIKSNYLIIGYWLLVIGLLIYTRFIGLGWGLPYPMHPDERNMANAIQQMNCEIPNSKLQTPNKYLISNIQYLKECFNPHFFAYGQFPLYLGYLLIWVIRVMRDIREFWGWGGINIGFEEAVMSLRAISAAASVINAIIIIKIITVITKNKRIFSPQLLNYSITLLLIIFSPFFIQFSHFGTTESLLMLFYSLIVYYSLKILETKINTKYLILTSLFLGLAIGTKISSIIFLIVPATVIVGTISSRSLHRWFLISFLSLFFGLIFSPHNIINFQVFLGSVRYESDIAFGRYVVFYTRQFIETIPIWFQLTKIFPYALGWPVFVLGGFGLLGVLGVGWKDKKINLLLFAFLAYFLPNAFLFAKWTRFMAPVMPIILILAIVFLERIKIIKVIKIIIIILAILPGVAYLSIYQHPDVRLAASEWIDKNIASGAYILSETANVVDLPLANKSYNGYKNYKIISFNFYDLDENPVRQEELKYHLSKAGYIFVPSRRIFANHTCENNFKFQISNFKSIFNFKYQNNKCNSLEKQYPLLNSYYRGLFSGGLGFEKAAEFNSFPKICFPLTDRCLVFNDEQAEETWSVFDHPLVRIYKRVNSY